MRVAAGMILLAAPVAAQAAGEAADIDVPAGPLGKAVAALSRQARIDIGVDDASLHRIATSPVRGRMAAEAALDQMLRGTPATWRRGRGGLFHIVRRPRAMAVRASLRPAPPAARPAAPVQPAEIIVTASKRDIPLDDYPAMVTVLPGDPFANGIAPGGEAIVRRLSGVGSTHLGPGRNKLFVRGIIDSSFHGQGQVATAQYLDHVQINHNGPDPDLRLYDIAAVELLEGPQGTLYGAGAIGGLIRVVSNRPRLDRIEGRIGAGVSQVAHGEMGGDMAAMFNIPLVRDTAGLRVVGYSAREGGYIDNPLLGLSDINGVIVRGGRAAMRVDAGGWTIDVGGIFQSIDADDSQWTDREGAKLSRSSLAREAYVTRYRQANVAVERDFGDVRLVSSLALVRRAGTQQFDDGKQIAPFVVTQRARSKLIVGETRLSSRRPDGTGWVAGIGFLDSDSLIRRANGDGEGFAAQRQSSANRSRELALFGEANVGVARGVALTGGFRLSRIRLHGTAWAKGDLSALPGNGKPLGVELSGSDLRVLPSLALSVRPSNNMMLYARYQEGFRPGGVGLAGPIPEIYRGDRLRSWEIGQHLQLGGGVRVAIAASYARWHGILAEIVSQSGDLMTVNIGDGGIASIETRADWRSPSGWSLSGGGFVARSRLTRSNIGTVAVRGARLPNVPNIGLQASVGREWRLGADLSVKLAADVRYVGGSRIGAGPRLDAGQGDYIDDHLTLRVGDTRRGLSLEFTNLADAASNRFAIGTPYRIYHPQATPQRPRTIRIGFDAAF